MFNRGAFNHVGFNRPFTADTLASVSFSSSGSMAAKSAVELVGVAKMSAGGSMTAVSIRERYGVAKMSASGSMTAASIRERYGAAKMSASGTLSASGNRYQVRQTHYTGNVAPGDRVTIDTKKMTVTLNNVNALQYMEGEFIQLTPGTNDLVYADAESSRTVRIRVSHRDTFV